MDNRYNETRSPNTIGSLLAIALSSIALVFLILAYNRTGEDIQDTAIDGTRETIQQSSEVMQDTGNEIGEGFQEAADTTEGAIDRGPDGVDDGSR